MEYNVYCDESCHLEHDGINDMSIGAIWVPKNKVMEINKRIRDIKERNNFCVTSEAKWTKVCTKNLQLYFDLINFFFDTSELKFRCLLVPDKTLLDHNRFNQTHDDWYYKMYFEMLSYIYDNQSQYNTYIDIKDTNSFKKSQKLYKVCCNSIYDFSGKSIIKIQPIRSHEVEIMQLVDILIGAVTYINRRFPENHKKSHAKLEVLKLIKQRSSKDLTKTSMLREDKFNLFVWRAH